MLTSFTLTTIQRVAPPSIRKAALSAAKRAIVKQLPSTTLNLTKKLIEKKCPALANVISVGLQSSERATLCLSTGLPYESAEVIEQIPNLAFNLVKTFFKSISKKIRGL